MPTLTQPIKYFGGKKYLAKDIIALMPPRCKNPNKPAPDDKGWLHYCEPFFGGGAVLLANDPEGISEVINDLNGELTNFWRVLQSEDTFQDFHRCVEAMPFSEKEFNDSEAEGLKYRNVGAAINFFIRCRQSLSGRMNGFASITRNRVRRGMNEQVAAWLGDIEGLPDVHARLKRVLILNHDALRVIRQQDGPRTLFYCDPPYLHETRVSKSEYGEFEMTEADHVLLLEVLSGIQGYFLLSGYRSELYDEYANRNGWTRTEFEIANHAAGGKEKRRMVECLWRNYNPEAV